MNSIQPLENASQIFFSPNLVNLSKLEKKGPIFCWLSFTVSSMRRAVWQTDMKGHNLWKLHRQICLITPLLQNLIDYL
ncbi:hypothetical protein NC651_022367 [Populus alba x Populus x berolinensis]|nr:hypothetical protein NC651_022367 [Populus alba x Populus x berolinensis]